MSEARASSPRRSAIQQVLGKFLAVHHLDVVTAATADQARDYLHNRSVDAAIVDIRLPQGSGRDIVVSIPQPVPVIIFSEVPDESWELERLRPRTKLVAKPYSLVLIVETIREMLRIRES